ncbi:hypothetical protein JW877_06945 [bacterium]|nr:hypothetical protein [bacterium]
MYKLLLVILSLSLTICLSQAQEWVYTGGPQYIDTFWIVDTVEIEPDSLEIDSIVEIDTFNSPIRDIDISEVFPDYMLVCGKNRVWRYRMHEDEWDEVCNYCSLSVTTVGSAL